MAPKNPKVRQTIYAIGLTATSLLSVLSLWKIIDPNTASVLNASLTGLLSLLGVGAAGTAAVVVSKQQKDGTFDVNGSPAEQAIQAINATIQNANTAVSDLNKVQDAVNDLNKVRDAVSDVIADVPVLGPLGAQVFDQITRKR